VQNPAIPIPVAKLHGTPEDAAAARPVRNTVGAKHVLTQPNSPSEDVTVAFSLDHESPIEFLEFARPGSPFRTQSPGSGA